LIIVWSLGTQDPLSTPIIVIYFSDTFPMTEFTASFEEIENDFLAAGIDIRKRVIVANAFDGLRWVVRLR
jgi:hypothetical protein